MNKTVIELFAGVGGFRVGLNDVKGFGPDGLAIENGPWKFVWANQWEPATKRQDAFNCYSVRFGSNSASNEDICLVDKRNIPDHVLLTGGFPCQDYSVAHPKNSEKGIEGKKGVLWWQINDILKLKKPKFALLENVDRLLKSPSKQRGQAFGIILRCFADAGYGVQWRVINAADYGHPQKRRRIFIFAFHRSTEYFKKFSILAKNNTLEDTLVSATMFSPCFPASANSRKKESVGNISKAEFPDLVSLSNDFKGTFYNTGYMLNYLFYSLEIAPSVSKIGKTLGECLDSEHVPDFCYKINLEQIRYQKGAKRIKRKAKNGYEYTFSEGAIPFPDRLDIPSRTMLTSEGSNNRSTHLVLDPVSHRYRILTPVECERLDEFPDNWTKTGMSDKRRYFIAGNALVCGLVKSMGDQISSIIDEEK